MLPEFPLKVSNVYKSAFFNHNNHINNNMELNIKNMVNIINNTALLLNNVLNRFYLCNCFL